MNNVQEKSTPTQEEKDKATSQSSEEQNQSYTVDIPNPLDPFQAGLAASRTENNELLDNIAVHQEGQSGGLQNCYDKLEVRNSPIEGYGVFATQDIKKGSVLEEIPFVLWPRNSTLGEKLFHTLSNINGENWVNDRELTHEQTRAMFEFKHPDKYYFRWSPPNADGVLYNVLPLGFGPIYNSSNTDNNAGWRVNRKTFSFVATRDISKGEEVCTFYGYFLSDKSEIFNVSDVFGLGLDYNKWNDPNDNQVYLRCLRFRGQEEAQVRAKDTGVRRINELLRDSGQRLKIRKVSIIENNEENHEFIFPQNWSMHNHYLKLKEFRFSRFKNIKLVLSYEDEEQKKKNKKAIEFNNALAERQGDPKEVKQLEEHGHEVVITNFNGL